jgi:uncharacterized protein with HEPN domain
MKRNSYRLFLEDMLEAINKIERYIQDLTRDQFEGNDLVIDAVIRNLEIIGEAAKNVPEDIKKKYPTIPWNRMIGLRNVTIHEYFGVDLNIIWEIITKNLSETKPKIEAMLKDLSNP